MRPPEDADGDGAGRRDVVRVAAEVHADLGVARVLAGEEAAGGVVLARDVQRVSAPCARRSSR